MLCHEGRGGEKGGGSFLSPLIATHSLRRPPEHHGRAECAQVPIRRPRSPSVAVISVSHAGHAGLRHGLDQAGNRIWYETDVSLLRRGVRIACRLLCRLFTYGRQTLAAPYKAASFAFYCGGGCGRGVDGSGVGERGARQAVGHGGGRTWGWEG